MLALDLEGGFGSVVVIEEIAGGQIGLSDLDAGQMVEVGVVHFVHTSVKHLDEAVDEDSVDGIAHIVGTNEDLVVALVVPAHISRIVANSAGVA